MNVAAWTRDVSIFGPRATRLLVPTAALATVGGLLAYRAQSPNDSRFERGEDGIALALGLLPAMIPAGFGLAAGSHIMRTAQHMPLRLGGAMIATAIPAAFLGAVLGTFVLGSPPEPKMATQTSDD